MDELFAQTKSVYTLDDITPKKFPKRMAFNVIPHIDVFMDDGSPRKSGKMVAETKKILDPKIKVVATCVRVPVFVGHSEAVNIEFEKPITAEEARDVLRDAPGVIVIDKREAGGYVTPYEAAGEDATYVRPHPRGTDGRERSCGCGASRTICARARRSMRFRSPNASSSAS